MVYAQRVAPTADATACYRLPDELSPLIGGRRVAIVDDAINAASASLATRDEIARLGGDATVAAAIFLRDPGGIALLKANGLAVEHLIGVPFTLWAPTDCPLCRARLPIERTA